MQQASAAPPAASARAGVLYALGAYGWWGLVGPLYFHWVGWVPSEALIAHRIAWSMMLLVALVVIGGQVNAVSAALRNPRLLCWLLLTSVLLAVNWGGFIIAVATHRLLQASFGYFINPIVTILLGVIFLRERLRPAQIAAVLLATAGLATLAISRNVASAGFPWIAVILPLSFGFYSLIRKRLPVAPLSGLAVETALLTIPSVAFIAWFHASAEDAQMLAPATWALLAISGVITTLPMLWYVAATKRLTLTTIGFLQFLAPALQLLCAVLYFGEPFSGGEAAALALIAIGVALDLAATARRRAGAALWKRVGTGGT